MKPLLVTSLCLGSLLATPSLAHDDGTLAKARQLGISVGKTYSCTAEEDREEARADFEEMFDMFYHVDGKELAFVFAVAIGYGAAQDTTQAECENLLPLVTDTKAELGLGGTKK